VCWYVAMRPGKRNKLDKANSPVDALMDKVEKLKASIRAKVEHPFRVVKRQFGYVKVRYRGLKKNTLQLKTLFALFALVDGQAQLDGGVGMSASKGREIALNRTKRASMSLENGLEKPESKASSLI